MTILSLMAFGTLMFAGTANAQNTVFSQEAFTDVPVNSSDYQAIEFLRTQNVVRGYIDGTFRPNIHINRAEFVEFIINPYILDTNGMGDCIRTNVAERSSYAVFRDVHNDDWFAENLCFAKSKSIINGYPDDTFRPEQSINFVEASKIIANVFNLSIKEYQVGEFWYRSYVQNLSDLHAIPTTIRGFNQKITRGEMAQIVYRLKTDSSMKSGMGFDLGRNTLYLRAAVAGPVIAPEPIVPIRNVERPSRRSIMLEAEIYNNSRL